MRSRSDDGTNMAHAATATTMATTKPAGDVPPEAGRTDAWGTMAFEDRMATVDFRVAERAHIEVDGEVCRSCTTRSCVGACPAALFVPTADGGILFNYEECFECGTCYMICNNEGAITWSYPEGGHGVVYKKS